MMMVMFIMMMMMMIIIITIIIIIITISINTIIIIVVVVDCPQATTRRAGAGPRGSAGPAPCRRERMLRAAELTATFD